MKNIKIVIIDSGIDTKNVYEVFGVKLIIGVAIKFTIQDKL